MHQPQHFIGQETIFELLCEFSKPNGKNQVDRLATSEHLTNGQRP